MKISQKAKSNIIYWGIFGLFALFLFYTPWGESFRSWAQGLLLSSPPIETSMNLEEGEHVKSQWFMHSTEGEEISFQQIDKPIFVNIWATWCPPCRAELPSIIDLQEKYKGKVEFVLISPDETEDKLKKFKEDKGYNTTFYSGHGFMPYEFSTGSYPTTFILNKDKEIVYQLVGGHDWDTEGVHYILDELVKQ